jgi:RNA polymerase sigma factor (sigma-70 family)
LDGPSADKTFCEQLAEKTAHTLDMSKLTDRELVARAQRGDGAAIGELFSRYWRAARAAAFGVTGEFAAAEDAASEAFQQALMSLTSLRDPDRFGPWLRTIVVRKAQLGLQRRHFPVDALADVLSDQNESPDSALERHELEALLQQAMRELPERLREAIALFYFEGYDSDDAARFLDIPAGTLRRRLHDGRTHLRDAVERILQGSKKMNEDRERQIQRFKNLIADGEVYQALRESLALRPAPSELIHLIVRRQAASASSSQDATGGKELEEKMREMVQRFLRLSDRASNPNHPVGAAAAAIRNVLSDFHDWPVTAGDAAERFFTLTDEHREHGDRLKTILPPGFAEGRPGAFIRGSRALLYLSENGPVQSVYEHLQASPDQQMFRGARKHIRISDVLDMTWMVTGSLELRSVQELLERLSSAVLPGTQVRFSSYDEPRYRSALQLHVGNIVARAAHGGVLSEWSGRPEGVDAAHLRIFLEPWATVRSGQVVELDRLPMSESDRC